VAAVDGLRPAIAEIRAIDHHAHLLVSADTSVALAAVLTESSDPAAIEAVRDHPTYHRALIELGDVLDVSGSDEVFAAARRADFAGYVGRLLDQCHLAAIFVDDGFRPPGVVALDEHAALVGCDVRRVVRLEAEAEAASAGWPPFPEYRAAFGAAIADAVAAGAVGLKTIAAYRCGLDLPPPSVAVATDAYETWRRSGSRRLGDAALVSLAVADALEAAGDGVPLQVHAGIGDADLALAAADPALLQAHIDHGMLAGVPIVLLHCYPYVRQAGYLASIYNNVHLDVSLAVTLLPHRASTLVAEALELAPASKLLFASDASRLPEMYLLGTRWWREALARTLGGLVDDGFIDEPRALRWAELILAGNARRLYRFEPA
jgi:predicted TIM-barrel fold metal-dependent hydrolase